MFMSLLMITPFMAMTNLYFTKKKNYFFLGLLWSFVLMMMYCFMLMNFMKNMSFQFNSDLEWLFMKNFNLSWGYLGFSMDGVSLFFMGLSMMLMPMSLIASMFTINKFNKEFYMMMFIMLWLLIMVFMVMDLMGFYILFETMLIPVFMMMGVWGSSQEKMKAAFYFFFYTLMGSLLMLLSMFKIYSMCGTTDYSFMLFINIPKDYQFWLFLGFSSSLLIKMPMIPSHIWLPQAHVEAPMSGSMLLAGMLLKLGGYGFMSFSFTLFPMAAEFFSPVFMTLSMIAMIYGALNTCSQMDMKSLIAYSSVSHMGLVTLSMFCHSTEGLMSSIMMMMAHGFVSSGLFMVSSMMYFSFHSSLIKYFKGLVTTMPIFSSISFMLMLGNMSFPLTMNFMGELISMISVMKYSMISGVLTCMGMFMSMVYSLYLYNSMFFGKNSSYIYYPSDLLMEEFHSFTPLIFLIIFLGLNPNFIMNFLIFSSYMNMSI